MRRVKIKLFVPELKIGTLDSLLALSDDLQKINGQIENVTQKIKRQIPRDWRTHYKIIHTTKTDDNNENNNNSNEAFAPHDINRRWRSN